jgi:hypothetical protein
MTKRKTTTAVWRKLRKPIVRIGSYRQPLLKPVARQLVVKIRIAIIGALLAIASAANADVGDTYQQLVHRFKSPPLPAGSWQSSAGNVVFVQFNTGYYVTTVMLIDGIVDGEAFQSTRHESSTKTNVSWLFDREMFKYGGSNNRWRRWTIYRLQSGWGYARPDGRMFVEATQDSDNLWGVAVVSDKGYRAVGSEMRSVTQSPNNLQQQPAVQSKENDCMINLSLTLAHNEQAAPFAGVSSVNITDWPACVTGMLILFPLAFGSHVRAYEVTAEDLRL